MQSAIDKYEDGDAAALEDMINSGALLVRTSDVDLLGDLDLDFLNVHEEEGHDNDGLMFGNMNDLGGGNESGGGHDGTPGCVHDGIGDLEFNGDFTISSLVLGKENSNSTLMHSKARGNSVDDIDIHRMRANSLALPGLLLDGANPDDSQISFGRWMDKEFTRNPAQHPIQLKGGTTAQQRRRSQFSSECDVLMASEFAEQNEKPKAPKERKKKMSPTRKEKKEPRERKSQAKMKDMMEGISSTNAAGAEECSEEEEETKIVPSGLGRPRSMSDPNLSVRLDDNGLLHVAGPEGWVGAYSPDSRHLRVSRFLEKRNHRVWVKKVKYDVRKVRSSAIGSSFACHMFTTPANFETAHHRRILLYCHFLYRRRRHVFILYTFDVYRISRIVVCV